MATDSELDSLPVKAVTKQPLLRTKAPDNTKSDVVCYVLVVGYVSDKYTP